MTKRLLINIDAAERRIAIADDGNLENLIIEAASDVANRGNIFKGVIKRVEPSLQAAFVDYGAGRDGFLGLDEIHPGMVPQGVDRRAPIQKILKNKQSILVQVSKDEVGTKGAALTTYISLAGRFLVLMPENERTGISRKLSDEERRRLKEVLKEVELPDGFGVIARTAARSVTKADALKDLNYLTRLWQGIERRFEEMRWPGLIYEDSNLAIRFVRDYFTNDIEEIWVDDHDTWQEVHDFVSVLMPRQQQKVRLYSEDDPLFTKFGVEDQIDHIFTRQVPLPSGGSVVIDETEALVAIDVNSGKTKEKNAEDTIFQTNMEAATEIARQAMLRDLGGLIVVDFIDMKESARKKKVETALKLGFKSDKARTRFGRISTFGLLEFSRQRLRTSVRSRTFLECPHCEGTGTVRGDESSAVQLLRRLRSLAATSKVGYVRAELPPNLAHFLLNNRRRELQAIERDTRVRVEIFDDPAILSNNVRFELHDVTPREAILPKPAVVRVHGSDPMDGEKSGREKRAEARRGDALKMYDKDLIEQVRTDETPEAPAEPEAPAVPAAARPQPAKQPAKSPAPAEEAPDWSAASEPPPLPREAVARWSGPVEAMSVPPGRWGGVGGRDGADEERSRPLRWLRRLFGAPEPAPTPPVRPRTVVIPEPPAAEPVAEEEELLFPRADAADAASDRRDDAAGPAEAGGAPEAAGAESQADAATRKRRRRGGRTRRKSNGEAPKPTGEGAREATAVAPRAPAGGGRESGAADDEKTTSRRRRTRRPAGATGDAPRGDAPRGDAPRGDAPRGDAPRGDAPRGDAPRGDAPRGDAPRGDAPRGDAPRGDAPRGDAPRGEGEPSAEGRARSARRRGGRSRSRGRAGDGAPTPSPNGSSD